MPEKSQLSQEDRMKVAFLEFIKDVFKMRQEQQEAKQHRTFNTGSVRYRENIVDDDLKSMGIDETTDWATATIQLTDKK